MRMFRALAFYAGCIYGVASEPFLSSLATGAKKGGDGHLQKRAAELSTCGEGFYRPQRPWQGSTLEYVTYNSTIKIELMNLGRKLDDAEYRLSMLESRLREAIDVGVRNNFRPRLFCPRPMDDIAQWSFKERYIYEYQDDKPNIGSTFLTYQSIYNASADPTRDWKDHLHSIQQILHLICWLKEQLYTSTRQSFQIMCNDRWLLKEDLNGNGPPGGDINLRFDGRPARFLHNEEERIWLRWPWHFGQHLDSTDVPVGALLQPLPGLYEGVVVLDPSRFDDYWNIKDRKDVQQNTHDLFGDHLSLHVDENLVGVLMFLLCQMRGSAADPNPYPTKDHRNAGRAAGSSPSDPPSWASITRLAKIDPSMALQNAGKHGTPGFVPRPTDNLKMNLIDSFRYLVYALPYIDAKHRLDNSPWKDWSTGVARDIRQAEVDFKFPSDLDFR